MGIRRLLPQLDVTAAQVGSHLKLPNPRSIRGKEEKDQRNLELGMIQSELHGLVERARRLDIGAVAGGSGWCLSFWLVLVPRANPANIQTVDAKKNKAVSTVLACRMSYEKDYTPATSF
jgi:hypothetical protein